MSLRPEFVLLTEDCISLCILKTCPNKSSKKTPVRKEKLEKETELVSPYYFCHLKIRYTEENKIIAALSEYKQLYEK